MAVHTVQSGDTLWDIAKSHHVSVEELVGANPAVTDPNKIYPGQELRIPDHFDTGTTPEAPSSPVPGGQGVGANAPDATTVRTFQVGPGDTMTSIAKRHGVTLQALVAANPQIADPNKIYPGQTLMIPGGAEATPAPATGATTTPGAATEPPVVSPSIPSGGAVTQNLGDALIDKIINNTSKYEGSYTSLNRNSDGAGLSFGFIQFAQGPGSLGTLLTAMRDADPAAFRSTFGPDSDELVGVTTSGVGSNKDPVGGNVLWEEPWVGRFTEAGNNALFQAVQRRLARTNYFEPMLPTAAKYGVDTERGLGILYDMAVQHGVGGMRSIVTSVIAQGYSFAGDERAALMACAETSADHVKARWHDHVLNRRMSIIMDPDLGDVALGEGATPVDPSNGVGVPGAFTPPSVTLEDGARGPAVVLLQQVLEGYGFTPGTVNGIFGPRTEAAVKSFQASAGITADGIVGPQTWAALAGGEAPGAPSAIGVPVADPTTGAHLQAFPVAGGQFNIGWDQNWNDFSPATGLQNTDFYLGGTPGHPTGHHGLDIFGPKGAPLAAPVTGEIVSINFDDTGKGGRRITIKRGDHYFYLCHLDSVAPGLKVGDTIDAGTQVGTLGNSGNASGTAPHLHFSIYRNGNYTDSVDPFPFLVEALQGGD